MISYSPVIVCSNSHDVMASSSNPSSCFFLLWRCISKCCVKTKITPINIFPQASTSLDGKENFLCLSIFFFPKPTWFLFFQNKSAMPIWLQHNQCRQTLLTKTVWKQRHKTPLLLFHMSIFHTKPHNKGDKNPPRFHFSKKAYSVFCWFSDVVIKLSPCYNYINSISNYICHFNRKPLFLWGTKKDTPTRGILFVFLFSKQCFCKCFCIKFL